MNNFNVEITLRFGPIEASSIDVVNEKIRDELNDWMDANRENMKPIKTVVEMI